MRASWRCQLCGKSFEPSDDEDVCPPCTASAVCVGWNELESIQKENGRLCEELQRERLDALTQAGQCIEEHIWAGHPKYDALVAEAAEARIALVQVKHDEERYQNLRRVACGGECGCPGGGYCLACKLYDRLWAAENVCRAAEKENYRETFEALEEWHEACEEIL